VKDLKSYSFVSGPASKLGDEEAETFADHHTLRLLAFGKKNLKEHQMSGATTA
jgi:hypothetical protein